MLNNLKELDLDLFLFIQNWTGNSFLDQGMIFLSDKYIWIPLYILIVYYFFKRFDKTAIVIFLVTIIAVGLSDFITSGILKGLVERPRPCHDQIVSKLFTTVQNCGGAFGFPSSHAANTAALATIIHLLFRNNYTKTLLLWSLCVSYSRIYLGAHYPLDVIVGLFIGAGIGCTFYLVLKKKGSLQ